MKVKVIIALALFLTSFGVFSQNAKIITQSNASPMQELFTAEKLPEGYEWLMIAPVINNINGYIKVALPSNIMNDNASTDNNLFSESKIKTNIFSIKLSSVDGKTAEFQKGTFFLTNSIKIAPPQKCYLDFNEFKKDKGFKNADLELGSKTTFIKFTPKKGELKTDGNIVVGIDKIHCGVKSYGPWVDLTMYGKPVYCAVDFAFACAKADEVSLIKNYMPLSANYLAQGYTNPAKRDLLNEIRPDGSSAVAGDKSGGIPITVFNDLETIEKFENSKESMHDLFNRVTASSTRQAIISLAAMHEVFDKGSTCGEGRKKALVDYVKSNIPKYYEQIALVTEEAIDDYIKVVPCGKYFFEPSIVEQNSKEFNLVISRINQFCKDAFVQYSRKNSAFTSSNKKLEGADDLSFMDRGLTNYATFSSKASKNMEILNADADKVAEENMGPAQFLLQQLMATNYFKFFYAESFSDYVGKFDLKRCVEGDSALNGLEMQPIPNDPTKRLELLKASGKELMTQAVKSINELLEIKNTIVHSTIGNEELSNHEDRKDKLVDYLLSYTLSFKQYKSISPASSREFLLSTKLIGEVLANDQNRANWNKAISIGASIIAVAGGILAITGIGAPAGSLLTAISATINSWAVLTVTTATVMVNAGVNWDKAVTEEEFARMAGSIDLRLDEYNYNDLVKAIDAKESAVSEAVTNIAFLALPVGAYKILKTFPKVSKVLGLTKVGLSEENAFKTFDLGVKRYSKANVSETEFGTLLSANKEDDALFKSILGKADQKNLDKITKKASSINNQQDYDVFMNNIKSSIDDTGNINFSKILKTSKSEYSFVNDIKLVEQKTTLDEFLNKLDSRGIKTGTKEYDALMSSFEKTHKAKGSIMDLSSDKYVQFSKLREEYSNILSNNKVPNALKTAREDLKPLLDTGVLGEWENGKFIGGRFFVPDKTGKDLYVRPGNNQLYKYNDYNHTMEVLPGQISANANNIPKVYGAQIQDTKEVLYIVKNRYVPTEAKNGVSYYKVGDTTKTVYYYNPKTGLMETKQSVLVRARMPILKEKALTNNAGTTNKLVKDFPKNAVVNEGPKEFLPKNYYQDENVTLLTTGVNDFTKIPTGGSSEIYTVNRTFLNNLKDNPAALEKGFKYYVDKDHNVHFFDFDGPDVHSSVFAKKGIPEIADAGWVTKMGSEGTIQVNGRNSKFNSKEFMIDYIKNKDPEFFISSGFADKGLVSINKANLDPKDFGANKLFKVEKTNIPLDKKTWPEYENSSVFGKDKLRNKELVELDTEIIDGALTTGEMEKYGLKFYIDEKGDITLSSVLYDHDQILQKHFLNKKDLIDYGYIQLTKNTVNGEKLLELKHWVP